MRHGKAKAQSAAGDHGRHLKAHGRDQARDAGAWLAEYEWPVQRCLVSSAVRAQETAEGVLDVLSGWQVDVVTEPELYLADAEQILRLIGATPASCQTLLVVGHNPGLSQLALQLAQPMSFPGLSTGALAVLRIQGNWQDPGVVSLEQWREPAVG